MTRRRLDVGPDGTAPVLCLEDPIPRHVSLVSWGANDAPTTSWKSADGMDHEFAVGTLRRPPGGRVVDISRVTSKDVQEFVSETLDAWSTVVGGVLATPLSPQERGARVRAITVQAGARIAAMATALTPKTVARVAKAHRVAGLKMPEPPTESTLQGELDRRRFMAGIEAASAALTDGVMGIMKDAEELMSVTESILGEFAQAADMFSRWAESMPAGVIGVSPDGTQKAGKRNSRTDEAKIKKIRDLLSELLGDEVDKPPKEARMSITITDLQQLVENDPKGFLDVLGTAIKAAKDDDGVDVSKKFFWGETGLDSYDPEAILAKLRDFGDGTALLSLIASAVGGIEVENPSASPMINESMKAARSALISVVTAEMKAHPNGDLAVAVKTAVAPSVAKAITESFKAAFSNGTPDEDSFFDGPGDDDPDPLIPEMPSLR